MTLETPAIPRFDEVLRRHALDAAFYWRQLDGSLDSFHLTPERLDEFSLQMQAHLEGLLSARREGWSAALNALERWRQPGEVFVATWLAGQVDHPTLWQPIWSLVHINRDGLIRAMVSAFAWLPTQQRTRLIQRWLDPNASNVQKVVALRAAALTDLPAEAIGTRPLADWLNAADPWITASACRWASSVCHRYESVVPTLRSLLSSDAWVVRTEAAIALTRLGHDDNGVLSALWRGVAEQTLRVQAASGWYLHQEGRRLRRWLAHLAHAVPVGHPGIEPLLAQLPQRSALLFALHHGRPEVFPYVLEQMEDPAHQRLAGWVWQTMTGWNLEQHGLVDSDVTATEAMDAGLPRPDAAAVRALHYHLVVDIPEGSSLLYGEALSLPLAADVLEAAPQAVRHVVALALSYGAADHVFQVRAPLWKQRPALHQLRMASADDAPSGRPTH